MVETSAPTSVSALSPAPIRLEVNGRTHEVRAEAEMPLLWALRDVLGLTGTKYGCGQGMCGACTVHIEGQPVRSCSIRVGDVAGKVTTIEGVGGPVADRVMRAWIEHQVAQCGYCQPGQVMTAIALLSEVPDPDDVTIDRALAGNLCRCATYLRIRRAIRSAAREAA